MGEARDWPGATVMLTGEANAAWSVGLLALIWATLSGRFTGRRRALIAAAALMLGWTLFLQRPVTESAIQVRAMAVGNGSCFVVRTANQVVMFDCGSSRYLDLGLRSIGPALRRINVRRIDTLVISHANLDHLRGYWMSRIRWRSHGHGSPRSYWPKREAIRTVRQRFY